MDNDPRGLMPGDRVLVFDYTLFKDDVSTPSSVTWKPATIIRRYIKTVDYPDEGIGWHDDLIDVDFDHRGESRGHFTVFARELD